MVRRHEAFPNSRLYLKDCGFYVWYASDDSLKLSLCCTYRTIPTNSFSRILAFAAASLATGTLGPEQET